MQAAIKAASPARLREPEELGEVKEDGGRKGEGVDAVENSAVARNEGAVVFCLVVALDGREGEVAEESAGGDEESHEAGLPPEKGSDPVEGHAKGGGGEDSADGSFEGFVG